MNRNEKNMKNLAKLFAFYHLKNGDYAKFKTITKGYDLFKTYFPLVEFLHEYNETSNVSVYSLTKKNIYILNPST